MHSIRRLLGLDNPNFALQHLTGDLYFDFPYTLNPHERGYYRGSHATDEYKVFSFAPENLPQNAEVFGDRDGNPFSVTSTGAAPPIHGMQGQAWGEVMRNDRFLEYMVYPRLLRSRSAHGTRRTANYRTRPA